MMIEEANKRRYKIIESVLNWSKNNLREYPWRRNRTPYRILVAEFLLRRTTASAVKRIYEVFLKKYPSISAFGKVEQKEIEADLRTLGFHKLRSKMLRETATYIIGKLDGILPCEKEGLMSIPNIGSYTAGAVLSLACDKPAPMVDSNVERLLKRVFKNSLTKKGMKHQLSDIAEILIPNEKCDVFNLALIDIGFAYCTYRKTHCHKCPICSLCDHGKSTQG